MNHFKLTCSKRGDEKVNCPLCLGNSIKNGKSRNGTQRFKCVSCQKRFQVDYHYLAYKRNTNPWIKDLVKEGSGIRSISRLLQISPTTVISRIKSISQNISIPLIPRFKVFELDEMCTFVRKKENRIWIAYAIRKDTKEVVSFNVGKRTNKTLRRVTESLILSDAKLVHTDKLRNYQSLLPDKIHRTKQYSINHIERMNLNLRIHLKRLSRRTICYSRSITMLIACLKIYFWG